MFAVVVCPGCRKPRGIKLSSQKSACPRCGRVIEVRKALIHFQSPDVREIKAFINALSDFSPPVKEEESRDPWVALQDKIKAERDPEERLCVIASGLSEILGTFTVIDVERVVPGKGEAYLRLMVENALVLEASPDRYHVL
ncbi:MAG: hypothetical protein WCY65_02005 [Candidatus Methanomethylophilaceae archaeon]